MRLQLATVLMTMLLCDSTAQLVFSTGYNGVGGLCLGDSTDRSTPTMVTAAGLTSVTISSLSAGWTYSLLLTNTGRVYSVGSGGYGRLGLGDTNTVYEPAMVTAGGLSSVSIVTISAGDVHSYMLSSAGRVYACGYNADGRLGVGDILNRYTPTMLTAGGLSSANITAICAGYWHSLIVSDAGRVYSNGYNQHGGLGVGDTTNRWTPTLIKSGGLSYVNIVSVSMGFGHSIMLSNTGSVYGAGANAGGQLGLGDTTDRWTPTLITAGSLSSSTTAITAISAGGYYDSSWSGHSLFLTSTGRVLGAGTNVKGELGLGDTTQRSTPTMLTGDIASVSFVAIVAGSGCSAGCGFVTYPHSLLLSSSGAVYCTGGNANGGLGFGDSTDRNVPTYLNTLPNITKISAGLGFSLFLSESGQIGNAGSTSNGSSGSATSYVIAIAVSAGVGILLIVGGCVLRRRPPVSKNEVHPSEMLTIADECSGIKSDSEFFRIYKNSKRSENVEDALAAFRSLVKLYCAYVGINTEFSENYLDLLSAGAKVSNSGNVEDLAVYLWTSRVKIRSAKTAFHHILQHALREDDPDLLEPATTIIRAISELWSRSVNIPWPQDLMLYRGGSLPEEHRKFFSLKKKFRIKTFFATYGTVSRAIDFVHRCKKRTGKVLWKVQASPDSKHMRVIYISTGGTEPEFLFLPYSMFTVTGIDYNEEHQHHEITLRASVNSGSEPLDLPIAPWY